MLNKTMLNKTMSSKISTDDINKLLEEDQIYSNLSYISFGNIQLGTEIFIISVLSFLLWIFLWFYLGLFKLGNYNIIPYLIMFKAALLRKCERLFIIF